MVKPQFEVGRERLGAGGVVRDPAAAGRRGASASRGRRAALGWHRPGSRRSPLPGPAGNVEFFLWLRREPDAVTEAQLGQRSTRVTADPEVT